MARKYYSSINQTSHTYSFYKNRRDDPKWEGDYLRIKAIRQRNGFIMFIILFILLVGSFYIVGKGGIRNNIDQNASTSVYSSSDSEVTSNISTEEKLSQSTNQSVDFDSLHQKTQLAMLLSVFYTNADITTLVYMSKPNEIIFDNPNISPVRFIDDHNGIFEIYDYNSNDSWVRNGQISKKELVDRYYNSSERVQDTQRVADSINMSYSSNSFISDDDS